MFEKLNNILNKCRTMPRLRIGMFLSTYENMKIVYNAIIKEDSIINIINAEIRLKNDNEFIIQFGCGSSVSAFIANDCCCGRRFHILLVDDSIKEVYVKNILRCSIFPYFDEKGIYHSHDPQLIYFNIQEE